MINFFLFGKIRKKGGKTILKFIIQDVRKQNASILINRTLHRFESVNELMNQSIKLLEELENSFEREERVIEICNKMLQDLVLISLLMDKEEELTKIEKYDYHLTFKKQLKRCFKANVIYQENKSIQNFIIYAEKLFGVFKYADYYFDDYLEKTKG